MKCEGSVSLLGNLKIPDAIEINVLYVEFLLSVTRGRTKIVPSFIEFDTAFFINYTILQNWAPPPPPSPHQAFLNAVSKPNKLYVIL